MGQTLYLDCFAGISGDMVTGCLLDLGADREKLEKALQSLGLEGYQVKISRVKKAGLDVCDFAVLLDGEHENHDHDMEYLHGGLASHSHEENHFSSHSHGHEENHHAIYNHSHESGGRDAHHTHAHRGLSEINEIICRAEISSRARDTALRIFRVLAKAEAEAHGVPENEVHFHEVGAVDSIIDIVAAAVCLDDLDVTEVIVPYLCEGSGMVRCQHGVMPVPVPAVTNIIKNCSLPIRPIGEEGEFVTPTGAAIAAAVRTKDRLPQQYQVLSTGMGAGKRNYARSSILRGMLLKEQESVQTEGDGQVWKLESNIDDSTGEALGFTAELLMENGAADVYYTPIFMKKNRPSYLLAVICAGDKIPLLEKIIFENTTTIGVRRFPVQRNVLSRQVKECETTYGKVSVKICTFPDGTKRVYPEYESIRKICREQNAVYWEVWQRVTEECRIFFA
ncbi:nickel pincer cofactor biosynthesis protein LarC [bacterium D16-51]|nr:nickel pincer cofactor biosynthesis protein LarC [bacterium D16-59]RKI60637.1 nickel pincer cofactor biosynthesis protein LarC [bacterium D16-51]